ncbi:MAG: alpha/beta hydrolase [Notoacmeibacter sp.]|nr:alpha/beta hydrolase [Notoacmeibacter sp.]
MNSTTVRLIGVSLSIAEKVSPRLSGRVLARLFLTPRRLKLREEERVVMEQSAALPLRFDMKRMFPVHHWGPESGPVVLLVHGWSGRAGQMGAFVAPLVSRGFKVVAFEAPAHGAADGRTTGLVEFARAIRLVERQFGDLHGIIAHSMGGAAALLAIAQGLSVNRLVLIGTPDAPGGYLAWMARGLGLSRRSVEQAQARIEARFGIGFTEIAASATAPFAHCATLVIHDRRDREVKVDAGRRIATLLPECRYMETDGLGHVRILKDGGVVDAVTLFAGSTGASHRKMEAELPAPAV